ncbi:hypothetical protein Tco_0982852 [Tanacetum coccineum]
MTALTTQIRNHPLALGNDLGFTNPTFVNLRCIARRSVRSKGAPTRYQGSYFDSFYHKKNDTFEYLESDEEIDVDKYYTLPPLDPSFQTPQPYTKSGSIS